MKQSSIGIFIVMMTLEAFAAATNAPAVSIFKLVEETLATNPEMKFYHAELEAARARRKSAGLLPNPELSGTVGQKSVRNGALSDEGMAYSVSIAQPFDWPGRLALRKAIANREIELATLGLERFKAALTARVLGLAYALFAAQQKALVAQEVAERYQSLREVLVQRDPAGITALLETRVIEASELTFKRMASDAAIGAETALVELNQLKGDMPAATLRIQESKLTFREAPAVDELLRLARTNNFELRARIIELAQQGLRVSLARNERWPTFTVGPSYSEERAGERERIIGISVSVPVPLWNRNGGNIEAEKARQTQAEASLLMMQRQVEREVTSAAATYRAKTRSMRQWREDAVQHFREAAELADRHYRLGAVPIATYVELQEKYLEAMEALLDTRREALEAAQNIQLLTGLPDSLVQTAEGLK